MPEFKPRKKSFIMREVNDETIRQRVADGYLDATEVCEAFGKNINDYLNLRPTKSFIRLLSKETKINVSELVQISDDEVWVHPQVAINLGQWVAPQVAVLTPKWVFEWMMENAPEPPEEKPKFVTSSGVRFEDIDSDFKEALLKAGSYNPRKSKK